MQWNIKLKDPLKSIQKIEQESNGSSTLIQKLPVEGKLSLT